MKHDEILKRLEMADNWLHLTDQQRTDVAAVLADDIVPQYVLEIEAATSSTTAPADLITTSAAAELAGVHVNTIRNWADRGYLTPTKLPSGVRRYDANQVKNVTSKPGAEFMQGLGVDPA